MFDNLTDKYGTREVTIIIRPNYHGQLQSEKGQWNQHLNYHLWSHITANKMCLFSYLLQNNMVISFTIYIKFQASLVKDHWIQALILNVNHILPFCCDHYSAQSTSVRPSQNSYARHLYDGIYGLGLCLLHFCLECRPEPSQCQIILSVYWGFFRSGNGLQVDGHRTLDLLYRSSLHRSLAAKLENRF